MVLHGTKAGQWSARKAQLAVSMYKEKGGGYTDKKDSNNSLTKWSDQNWRTKSGKPSHITGERYLPKKAIDNLSDKEYRKIPNLLFDEIFINIIIWKKIII